jgi:hypothetical protein
MRVIIISRCPFRPWDGVIGCPHIVEGCDEASDPLTCGGEQLSGAPADPLALTGWFAAD